ncbi:hypothetical protein ACWEWI_26615 [Streptomyces sp. NPDC003753]|uniref:hypothetical protein n=1 Tax=unclassified Streptomyces TaxID=2593676 RepID=UPI00190839A1|nr:hypothetical protein [Streptomyces sp. Y2F8-2]GHK02515.1 hypothetical protein SY2F82_43120 [Streptomyces sp. Y2F8-2]
MSTSKPSWSQRELPAFFRQWRTDWKDEELSPENYLDFEGGLRFVLAAAWLFCPETVEYRGCVFLKERFPKDTVDDWFTNLGGDRERIEAVANHVELWATFGNTPLTDDDQLGEELPQLALALGECWQGVLSARYPDREITVEVSDEEDGSYGPTVTFWTSPAISDFG